MLLLWDLCVSSCPFLICSSLLGWTCGANQLLYLHILPSLCVQCLQPPLINAVERRQMKRRAEGRETTNNSQEGICEKAELQKKRPVQWLGFESVLHAKLTSYLHSTSLSLQQLCKGPTNQSPFTGSERWHTSFFPEDTESKASLSYTVSKQQ